MMLRILTIFSLVNVLFFNLLNAQDTNEPNNDFSNATLITCGNVYDAFIQELGDVDWYEVQLTQDGYLSVDVNSVPASIDINLEIHQVVDNQLKFIADDNDDNASSGQSLTTTAYVNAGTYYILVEEENNNSFEDMESYSLTVSCIVNASEVNQTIGLAFPIAQDTCFEDNIWGENECFFDSNVGADDQDWFEVQLNESGKLSVDITSIPNNLDVNLEIYTIENDQPKRIADDDDGNASGGQDVTATAFVSEGTYYIRVEDENNNFTTQETYNFCVSFFPNAFEINQTIDLAALIPQDTCFEDNIWGENECFFDSNEGDDDQDWFEVQLNEPGKLSVDITSIPNNLDVNLEIYIIENGQPKRIADDDDGNASGGQDVTATAFVSAGTYYIHIEDENHNFTIQETYNLCVSFFPNAFEINQTIDLAALIPQDTCFEDNIWGENECFFDTNEGDDDQDWFEVQISEPGKLNVTITSVPSNLDLNLEMYIIENEQPKRIADDDDNAVSGGQELAATAFVNPGTYYVHIEDENFNTTVQETYTFCISFSPNAFEVNQTIDLAAPIPQDTCFEDNIWGENECYFDSNEGDDDQDWFEVQIDTACTMDISLTDVPDNLDLNLEIYQIVDGQATLIADDGDGNANGGQELSASFSADPSLYYIHIEDENNNFTTEETFTFCISCEPLVSTNETDALPSKIYPNPTDGIVRVAGFNQDATYSITDLSGNIHYSATLINNEIDLSSLPAGLYFIAVSDKQNIQSWKIIKL